MAFIDLGRVVEGLTITLWRYDSFWYGGFPNNIVFLHTCSNSRSYL